MKNINQIRENYNLITEKEDTETRKLVSLVRAGLFDAKKLPILKRALEKDSNKMTPAERKILIELLDSLMGEVLGSQQVYSKVKQSVGHNKDRLDEAKVDYLSKYDSRYEANLVEKDLPTVIILKRKAIRIFPGRQKVGLYYSQSLDRYVSIPFGPGIPNINEDTNINEISTEYKMRKYAAYKEKNADIDDDDSKDDIKKTVETQQRNLRGNKFLKKIKDKDIRKSVEKVGDAAVEKRKTFLKSYDAPKKPGQTSNLTKGYARGDINTTDYLATKAGLALGNLFRRKKQNTPTTSTPAPTSIKESFRMKLNEKKHMNEVSASGVADTAAEVLVPGYSAYKEIKKGNYGQAAIEAGIDVAAGVAGAVTGGLGYGAIKGARAASKIAKATKTADAASDASKVAKTADAASDASKVAGAAGAAKGLSRGTKLQRLRARARGLARRIDPTGIGSGGGENEPQQPKDEPYRKALEPKNFSMKVNVSAPKGGSTTGYEKRVDNNYRKSLEQPVSESIKLVAEGKLDSCNLNIENNTVIINTSLAKKIDNLYESLNISNKRKMKKMLNERNIESFKKIVSFAVRQ
jgi:hypothetical protein